MQLLIDTENKAISIVYSVDAFEFIEFVKSHQMAEYTIIEHKDGTQTRTDFGLYEKEVSRLLDHTIQSEIGGSKMPVDWRYTTNLDGVRKVHGLDPLASPSRRPRRSILGMREGPSKGGLLHDNNVE